jgi:aromatic-L-amino-acid decarboxylase
MVPAKLRGQFVLRMAVCSRYTESRDIVFAWQELKSHADVLTGQQQLLKN